MNEQLRLLVANFLDRARPNDRVDPQILPNGKRISSGPQTDWTCGR
jgi:hypothetical protein